MSKKILFIALIFLLLFFTPSVRAVNLPTFPTCVNPSGSVRANYTNGNHGIPGSSATYTGSDTVYNVNSSTLIQCFCSTGGQGIQTNWLKADTFSDPDIKILESQGWILVPDGSAWGLESVPYLAQSFSFACASPGGGGVGGPNPSGSVLASTSTSGEVLGLAATGDSVYVISVYLVSFLFLILGLYLARAARHGKNTK